MNISGNDIEELLRKFHSGKIGKEEFLRLRGKVNTRADEELEEALRDHWEAYEDYRPLPPDKVEALYGGIRQKMGVSSRPGVFSFWLRIAAGVLLLLATGMTVLFYSQRREVMRLARQTVTVRSGESESSSVILPDGSKVRLNANSALSYRQDFGRTERWVELSGEGFFEVEKDEGKRFVVHTDFMDITVLGTTFNVYAYDDRDFLEMALMEGSVCVNTSRPPYRTLYAKPNEKITYSKSTGELTLETTSNRMETAWMAKELSFRHERMREVFRCMERRFGVLFAFSDTTFLDDFYTGTFGDAGIGEMLDVLKLHYGFDYTEKSDTICIRMK